MSGPAGDPRTPLLPDWLGAVPLDRVVRVDVALEGDWSGTVRAIWTRDGGFAGLPPDGLRHARLCPALELYFEGGWIGLHCARRDGADRVLDEEAARALVAAVERQARSAER